MSVQKGIKKLKANRIPVSLLNCKVDDMNGTKLSIASQFFCKPKPDFIINGKLSKLIKDKKGNKFTETPIKITT